jgi:hypothetical protein
MVKYQLSSCEFITVEEVASRLHVCRATMFNWLQQGVFTSGKHYFKRGRVLRFVWCDDLITAVLGKNTDGCENALAVQPARAKKTSPLNWEY